jgi:predicted transposase/invertase (TIGR01784 family)
MKPNKTQNPTNTKRNKKMFYEPINEKYVNPFTDFGFKKLFGEECNKDLLLDFLNELLYEEQGKIVSISYLKTEKIGILQKMRGAIFDIYCENDKGEKFIVELQKTEQMFFKDRTLYYSTFPIIEQAHLGDWNYELQAVYVIAILNFVFDEDQNDLHKYRYDVKLTDIETHKVFYDKLTFIYLEMPKFSKSLNELITRFDKWMYVIKNLKRLENLPEELRESIFEKIFKVAEIANFTRDEYLQYAENIKIERDNKNCFNFAIQKAEKKAEKQGMERGIEKGIDKGRAKGEEERLKLLLEIEELKRLLNKEG